MRYDNHDERYFSVNDVVAPQVCIGINDAGWFNGVRHMASPNMDDRPSGSEVSLLVIHNISLPPGIFGTSFVSDLFTNKLDCTLHSYFTNLINVKVSSHLFIDREGVVTQFVSLLQRAWHAGKSCFDDIGACNDFSIGIELEGTDTEPYTDAQYCALTMITQHIMRQYPAISASRIVGHSDIAPQRKTDPGPAFDWSRYLAAVLNEEEDSRGKLP